MGRARKNDAGSSVNETTRYPKVSAPGAYTWMWRSGSMSRISASLVPLAISASLCEALIVRCSVEPRTPATGFVSIPSRSMMLAAVLRSL